MATTAESAIMPVANQAALRPGMDLLNSVISSHPSAGNSGIRIA